MIKIYGILMLLVMLTAVSNAADWLEGGSVGRGDYGEVRQHFTDPVFYSPGSSYYASSDPAIRQMQESMDRYSSRYAPLGSMTAKSTKGKSAISASASTSVALTQPVNAAGSWHLELSDGTSVDMDLHQSGSRVFGLGSMTSSTAIQWAVASGDVTGGSLRLEVVPASGTMLYAISLDISRLHLPGSYTAFKADAAQSSGNVKANRMR